MERAIINFKTLFYLVSVTLGLVLLFQNCSAEHDHSSQSQSLVSSNRDLVSEMEMKVLGLFENRCSECHFKGTDEEVGPKNLSAWSQLIKEGYIVPGEPQNSSLYLTVIDGLMPKEAEQSLGQKEIDLLANWILALNEDGSLNSEILSQIEGIEDGFGGEKVTFQLIGTKILNPRCVSCHSSQNALGNVDLSSYKATMKTINLKQPGLSELYLSVSSNKMPQGGNPLSSSEKDLLLEWISQGASP